MAPRGRPPKRTSRMDAAIDAMKPFGFTEDLVIAKMRQLLKEYEGQYGFIELDAYSVLLESLISDQDAGDHQQQNQQVAPGETSNSKVKVEGKKVNDDQAIVPTDGFIDIPICSSTTHTVLPPPSPPLAPPSPPPPPPPPPLPLLPPPPPPPPPPSQPPPAPPVMDVVLPHQPHVLFAAVPPPEKVQPRRRKPCHGWICDDEELRFITLPSSFNGQISPPKSPPKKWDTLYQQVKTEFTGGRKNRPKRRSMWDLRPEDM